MSVDKRQKLKSLLDTVPSGTLVDSKWMRRNQISDSLCHDYAQRGWLHRLAQGVYIRPEKEFHPTKLIDWRILAVSMHKIMEIDFHVGGMTAIELHGLQHYIRMSGKQPVQIYAEKLPGWLEKIDANAVFQPRSLKLFSDPKQGIGSLRNQTPGLGGEINFPVSTPERAILEVLDMLPKEVGFDHLDKVFESLYNLSPRKLMPLLQSCRKVKIIRLFFAFADRHRHAWLKYLDKDSLDFGKGDRQFFKGGKIHPEYRITLPQTFFDSEHGDIHE
ncbi:MAG: type IV toxin-antitoxin system AbiEi family antitoxin [Gammaproteobacteria bacterium AqS3]|nr:type IV toxin-antitoxin system AbiEi family antitoxin [Gammaproteobacteria bacterium AqS3]